MTSLLTLNRRLLIFDDEKKIMKKDYEKKKLADRFIFDHFIEYCYYSKNILCRSSDG